MTKPVDATNSMPEVSTGDAGAALRSFMTGSESPSVGTKERWEPEVVQQKSSRVEDLQEFSDTKDNKDNKDNIEVGPESSDQLNNTPTIEELELKVKGFKAPVKIPKNFDDERVQSLLNKGARFEKAMEENARQRKELEAKIQQFQDYESKAEVAQRVELARKLMTEGYSEHALQTVLGEESESFLNSLVEQRIKYQNASPEERLRMDVEKQKRGEQLRQQKDADRIAKLEAQINARSEQVREAEYSGYIEDARSRYDLSQWVEDSDIASSLNEMLHSAAMADIQKLQRQREASGLENITQRDIRRAYAERAKKLVSHSERQSSKLADQKVSQQTEIAKANAQVASTKNYGQPDLDSEWKKSGGSMSDLVDLFRRQGGRGII